MAEAQDGGASQSRLLTATYKSPSSQPFSVTKDLSGTSPASVDDKVAYLKSLRAAVLDTQGNVNKELTARMEEDKAREAGSAVDEAKEEENYGEEVQGEDDD